MAEGRTQGWCPAFFLYPCSEMTHEPGVVTGFSTLPVYTAFNLYPDMDNRGIAVP